MSKWKDPDVPKKGWKCIKTIDLLLASAVCEMCEYKTIRFVHIMQHPSYTELRVGCICASNMELDPDAAPEREKALKSRNSRRANWLDRQWYRTNISDTGQYINTNHFHISVWQSSSGAWSGKVVAPNRYTRYSKLFYPDADSIKLACFDVMEDIKRKLASASQQPKELEDA